MIRSNAGDVSSVQIKNNLAEATEDVRFHVRLKTLPNDLQAPDIDFADVTCLRVDCFLLTSNLQLFMSAINRSALGERTRSWLAKLRNGLTNPRVRHNHYSSFASGPRVFSRADSVEPHRADRVCSQ